jgi:apurinic endonuclease APN1
MNYIKWNVGSHIGICKTLSETIQIAIDHGLYALQFFLGSPQAFNRKTLSKDDIKECQQLIDRYPLAVFSHFPYVANLAGSTKVLAWSGNQAQDTKTAIVLKGLVHELNTIASLDLPNGLSGVVIHPGCYPDRIRGLINIAKTINKIDFKPNTKLILENSAGQGSSLCTTLSEIRKVIRRVKKEKRKHIGVCIDTCHLFAYGEYNISKKKVLKQFFKDFDSIIGLKYLTLIHLNDSLTKFGSKKDRHMNLGQGHIWKDDMSSLFYLLNFCTEKKIPMVLETNEIDFDFLYHLSSL